jgi:predicted GNAT superfamily acetyltransferase
VLIVSIKRGGILLGAFDTAGAMKGFVYSIPALKHGRLSQWSHMMGVTPDARRTGIGALLKLAQRDAALQMGLDLIEWTYDPLQAANAHLNFARLGVVVDEYEENIYGTSSSPLHAGTPTDRFVAEWRLTSAHVEARLRSPVVPTPGEPAPVVNPSRESPVFLEPGAPNFDLAAPRLLVEIPMGFTEIQAQRPDLALAWRMSTRAIFQSYLGRGYHVADFFLDREHGRGRYLLTM